MINIYSTDFGSLKSESLVIDYIRWNLAPLQPDQIYQIALYFKTLGFNSYQKDRENSTTMAELIYDKRNRYRVVFILKVNYQQGTHIEFSGENAHRIFYSIKRKWFQWKKLLKHQAILRRLDICYDRMPKATDQISNSIFINESLQQFQKSHPNQNLIFYKNQDGLVVKIGHRQSKRHYRVYTKKDTQRLRFEFELKDKNKLKDYHILLQQFHFEEFEKILSYHFFKYSFEIFRSAHQPDHVDWLFQRVRPYQHRDSSALQQTLIYTDYINQLGFQHYQQKKSLITLLQLLRFVSPLEFKEQTLTSKFRQFKFPLRDFLNYLHGDRNIHHYRIIELTVFFNTLRTNMIMESFTNESYRMLVSIPEAKVYKNKKQKNSWVAEVWIADELFEYLCPFLYRDFFKQNLKKYEFAVLYEIIKVFCSHTTRKEFNIQSFFESYGSNLNGIQKKQIKECFIHYLKEFQQEGKLHQQALFPLLNTQSNPNSICDIHHLTSERLSQPFVVFEIVNVNFK